MNKMEQTRLPILSLEKQEIEKICESCSELTITKRYQIQIDFALVSLVIILYYFFKSLFSFYKTFSLALAFYKVSWNCKDHVAINLFKKGITFRLRRRSFFLQLFFIVQKTNNNKQKGTNKQN